MSSPRDPPPLVLVDEHDVPLGEASRRACHDGTGRLHRAFTALVLDRGGALLLARRARAKPLWPGHWDGSIASHPGPGEGYAAAARRRLREELGIDAGALAALEVVNRFRYRATDPRGGVEDEVCATVIAVLDGAEPAPSDGEIDALRWVAGEALAADLEREPRAFCPWLLLALALLRDGAACTQPAVATRVAALASALMAVDLDAAIAAHAVDAGWRSLG